jgi:hypothetical protein
VCVVCCTLLCVYVVCVLCCTLLCVYVVCVLCCTLLCVYAYTSCVCCAARYCVYTSCVCSAARYCVYTSCVCSAARYCVYTSCVCVDIDMSRCVQDSIRMFQSTPRSVTFRQHSPPVRSSNGHHATHTNATEHKASMASNATSVLVSCHLFTH